LIEIVGTQDLTSNSARKRHFRQRDEQSAVGHVMDGGCKVVVDRESDELRGHFL